MRSAGLKIETKGFTVATQDQNLFIKNFQANILHNGTDPGCRFCNIRTETINHFISGCTILAPDENTNRHNRVRQYMHWKICNHYDAETPDKWYEQKLSPVVDTPFRMIKNGTQKYVDEIPENFPLTEMQKIVLNSTAYILRRTLSL